MTRCLKLRRGWISFSIIWKRDLIYTWYTPSSNGISFIILTTSTGVSTRKESKQSDQRLENLSSEQKQVHSNDYESLITISEEKKAKPRYNKTPFNIAIFFAILEQSKIILSLSLPAKLSECVALWFVLTPPHSNDWRSGKSHSKFANAQRDTTNLAISQPKTDKYHLVIFLNFPLCSSFQESIMI